MRSGTIRYNAAGISLNVKVLLFMAETTASSESMSGINISVSVTDRELKLHESFALEVCIETGAACRGAQCVLSFDPGLVRCEGAAEGDFLRDWAVHDGVSAVAVPQPTIDNLQGHVFTVGVAATGTGGAKGRGVLFAYHFTSLADGRASPIVSDVLVIDASGKVIPGVIVDN